MNIEEPFVHRTVSAVGTASPAAAGALSSPFRMGQTLAAGAATETTNGAAREVRRRGHRVMPRARQALAACGTLTIEQLGEAVGETDMAKVRKLVDNGIRAAYWKRGQDASGNMLIEVSPPPIAEDKAKPRGFKGWLKRRGEPSAEAPRKSRPAAAKKAAKRKGPAHARKAAAKAPNRAARTVATSTPPDASQAAVAAEARALAADLTCGLFNTGELRLEVGDQVMRLTKPQVRGLIAYLDLISHALEE